ncbi:hypothetical protein ZIOFF_047090 [Zingiber officinale]|uniref:Uncharacterized protein n=1 Tax=Zingiber officinale TaxID=94328 RepID=A0A8J5KTF4_ZINOF|nr:hypothetical protein ZIOFF_047090 [Zingiber officinale]
MSRTSAYSLQYLAKDGAFTEEPGSGVVAIIEKNEGFYWDFKLGQKVLYEVKPEMKNRFISELQKEKQIVAMVGDGINDVAALASADVDIVMGEGVGVASDVSSVVLLGNKLSQGALPIYSSKVAVSVIDNVLLVHQVDATVVIMYDIFLDSLSPIAAPLPLLLRHHLVFSRQGVQVEDSLSSAYSAMIHGDNWIFLVPDLICDIDNGFLWRISLDLEVRNSGAIHEDWDF